MLTSSRQSAGPDRPPGCPGRPGPRPRTWTRRGVYVAPDLARQAQRPAVPGREPTRHRRGPVDRRPSRHRQLHPSSGRSVEQDLRSQRAGDGVTGVGGDDPVAHAAARRRTPTTGSGAPAPSATRSCAAGPSRSRCRRSRRRRAPHPSPVHGPVQYATRRPSGGERDRLVGAQQARAVGEPSGQVEEPVAAAGAPRCPRARRSSVTEEPRQPARTERRPRAVPGSPFRGPCPRSGGRAARSGSVIAASSVAAGETVGREGDAPIPGERAPCQHRQHRGRHSSGDPPAPTSYAALPEVGRRDAGGRVLRQPVELLPDVYGHRKPPRADTVSPVTRARGCVRRGRPHELGQALSRLRRTYCMIPPCR